MDRYSYIKSNYKRYINTTENNNHCYPMEIIEKYLNITNIDTKLQDIELTPQDHDNPVQHLEREISGTNYRGFNPSILVEMKIVVIETDNNIFGFESFSNTKVEKYLKYDSILIMPNPNINGDFTVNPDADLNDITIQLSSSFLTQTRNYVQLIDVLGDVGGLMEIVNMVFSIICSLIVDILYEKSLVNNLFYFDLDKKFVILKHIDVSKNLDDNNTKIINNKINEEMLPKNQIENKENLIKKKPKRKVNNKSNFFNSRSNSLFNQGSNKSSKLNLESITENKKKDYLNHITTIIDDKTDYKKENKNNDDIPDYKNMIKKIKFNKFYIYFGFCCVRNISNINNILLDEGMKLIIEQLDIFNIFRLLYKISKSDHQLKEEIIKEKMSDEFIQKLTKLKNLCNLT